MYYFHEADPKEIKARKQFHLKNYVMIGYRYTDEPYFLLGKKLQCSTCEFT